jgi:chaperone modulatory protein CbpM
MIINRLEFIQRVHIDQTTLDIWLNEQWLLPNRTLPDIEFSEIDLARAALILDLQKELGVNSEGVGIILDLVDQMHGLRKALGAVLPAENKGNTESTTNF